jgi:hypothetical protein
MATERFPSFGLATPPAPRAIGADEAIALLKGGQAKPASLLAYGNGRSYGDSCQNQAGAVIDMRSLNRIRAFNAESGVLEADAGVLLSDIIAHAAPYGFFPAVVPGTQFVTLGGAIANDVHGKNHHRRGTFGCHVEVSRCFGPMARPLLFGDGQPAAVCGDDWRHGADRSHPVGLDPADAGPSLDIVEKGRRFAILDEYFDLAEGGRSDNEYAVAWIDQLAGGRSSRARGSAVHRQPCRAWLACSTRAGGNLRCRSSRRSIVLNFPFLKLFNAAYYGRRAARTAPG